MADPTPAPIPAAAGSTQQAGQKRGSKQQHNKPNKSAPLRLCKNYNLGTCHKTADHLTDGSRWLHVCAFCFGKYELRNCHADSICEMKKTEGKPAKSETGWAGEGWPSRVLSGQHFPHSKLHSSRFTIF